MKQISLGFFLVFALGFIFISCRKTELQPAIDGAGQHLQNQNLSRASTKIIYVENIMAIPEGGCLTWRYSKRSFSGLPYCSQFATSDIARVYIKDLNTGLAVSSAKVTGDWSGGYTITGDSDVTNSDGYAFISGLSGYTTQVTFRVTNVTSIGSTYDATKNKQDYVVFR